MILLLGLRVANRTPTGGVCRGGQRGYEITHRGTEPILTVTGHPGSAVSGQRSGQGVIVAIY